VLAQERSYETRFTKAAYKALVLDGDLEPNVIEIDWALSNMTPKAVPVAPLGLLARQCHADADVDTAATIVAPTNIATRKRLYR
jgi:hypothetical protein